MPLVARSVALALLPSVSGLAAFVVPSLLAASETVYRCPGNTYQQSPCSGGRALRIDPATNAMQAPSAADRALAAQWDARANGPWVATLPAPPRMVPTPSQSSAPHGFGYGFPYGPLLHGPPAFGPPPRGVRGGAVPSAAGSPQAPRATTALR